MNQDKIVSGGNEEAMDETISCRTRHSWGKQTRVAELYCGLFNAMNQLVLYRVQWKEGEIDVGGSQVVPSS